MARSKSTVALLVVTVMMCMGGVCSSEVGQSAADSFWSTLAELFAQVIGDALFG